MKIKEYPQVTAFDDGDFLLKDGTNGTKIIKASDAAKGFLDSLIDPIAHASIYRGKSLGTSFTTAQKAAIADGSFKDLFVGDYWTDGSRKYRIADMDYFYNVGDTAFTKHHLVVVPDKNLYSGMMKSDGTTTGGYVNSDMRLTGLANAKTTISAFFGDGLLTHRDYLVNAVSSGRPSGRSWVDSQVEIMNEIMVYGCHIFSPANDGSNIPNNYTTAKKQLALFRLNPQMVNTREYYWLRDVVSSDYFAYVYDYGYATYACADYTFGVRPYFCIG